MSWCCEAIESVSAHYHVSLQHIFHTHLTVNVSYNIVLSDQMVILDLMDLIILLFK